MPAKRYTHTYSVVFTVQSNLHETASPEAILTGLGQRLQYLRAHRHEVLEAVGTPDETTDNWKELGRS